MTREDPKAGLFEEIDESLRKAYEELLNEDLPDRFLELIDRLRSTETEAGQPGKRQ